MQMKNVLLVITMISLIACNPLPPEEKEEVEETASVSSKVIHPTLEKDRYNVAFLIMDGVFNTELTAPFDIFHHTKYRDSIKAMNVFTVANKSDYVKTFEGINLVPDFNYIEDELPKIDILVVPSAEHHLDTDLEDEVMLDFVRKISKQAMYVMSHCDGAFVLAKSGILNGIESTTFPGDIEAYKEMFPELKVHSDVLFVHDDKFISSAGGAKSFEASLYLCEMMYGKSVANQLAQGMVIDWNLQTLPYVKVEK